MIRIISFSFLGLLLCALLSLATEKENTASSMDAADVGPVRPNPADIGLGYNSMTPRGGAQDDVTWTQVTDALHPVGRSGAGVLGNYLYCFGSGTANVGQAFNLTTELWEESTPPPLPLDNWCGVAVPPEDAIYLIGRFDAAYFADIQKFNPTAGGPTGTWTTVAPYPHAGCGIAAAWDGGDFIYAAGGNPTATNTTAYRYSISADAWTQLPSMPIGRSYCGGAYVQGKFFVFGGTVVSASNTMVAYDPISNTWSQMANLPVNVWFATFSATFSEGRVLSVGGSGGWVPNPAVQIYDPATNAWTLDTPLPAARECNSARYAGGGRVISAGGYVSGYYITTTYRGDGFPGGALPPNVSITITPVSPPIIIPPQGGSFDWDVTLHNNETTPQTFDVWTIITLPNGSTRPGWGPFLNLTMGAGATINRVRTQVIVERYPPGDYTYTGNVGDHPDSVWDSDSFPFTKLLGGDGGWAVERAHDGQGSTLTPGEYLLHGATPNPFNPITTIRFELRDASFVKLSVSDISGRQVAELVNGWRDAGIHEVTFDGSGLASGFYVYKLTAGDFHAAGKMALMK
jgi:hypothetical protein